MLMLAYCAGLRLGEIVRLNLGDFDTDNGTIEIRLSKFLTRQKKSWVESGSGSLPSE